MSIMLTILFFVVLKHTFLNFNNLALTVLKLLCYTTVFQLALIIPLKQVYYTFRKWGIKGDALITSLGSYIVWVDVINRSDKILTARFARGFIPKRTFVAKLKQLPLLLIPLTVGIIRTAVERSESWEQKNLLNRIGFIKLEKFKFSITANLLIIVISITWAILNIFTLWK